jgi:hypothetical protein
MWAVSEAFHFLHSEALYKKLYANCAIIPHEPSLIRGTTLEKPLKNWDAMSDIANYTLEPPDPTSLIVLEGDDMHTTFSKIMLGNSTFDAEVDALNRRYNEAYQKAKVQGTVNPKIYETPYSIPR